MDPKEAKVFRGMAYQMIDYIIDYFVNIRQRRVLPEIKPGYLRPLIPASVPEHPDNWGAIMNDIERVVMPGITHWHSPQFHAYFPASNTPPAILADILSDAIGCIGFSWIASPACTELEMVMVDWVAQLLGLPGHFLFSKTGQGGGVIQGSASESCFVALLAAKRKMILNWQATHPDENPHSIAARLVGYHSNEAHSSVQRAGLLGMVEMRGLDTDDLLALRGPTLRAAIDEDKSKGKIPFMVVGTLGTTSSLAFDNLTEIGEIASSEGMWLHIDAAYAGCSFVCPEFRYLMKGIEYVTSFNFNPHKWLLVNFDCSIMWVKNTKDLSQAFVVSPAYLKHEQEGKVPDFRHWQISLGRRFRSLKIWFVMRLYGANNIRAYIRKHVAMAYQFENLVRADSRFEVIYPVILGLVCFRIKGSNKKNEELLDRINKGSVIHIVHSVSKDVYFLRFAVCSLFTIPADVNLAWKEILRHV